MDVNNQAGSHMVQASFNLTPFNLTFLSYLWTGKIFYGPVKSYGPVNCNLP